MNMDVNLHRLADKIILILKFLVLLTIFMQHPYSTDGADIPIKASGKTVYNQEKMYLRNAAILYPITYLSRLHLKFTIISFILFYIKEQDCAIKTQISRKKLSNSSYIITVSYKERSVNTRIMQIWRMRT